ncbi:hypothetical protein RRG08_013906, partial [Elysia crispata]
ETAPGDRCCMQMMVVVHNDIGDSDTTREIYSHAILASEVSSRVFAMWFLSVRWLGYPL